MLQTGSILVIDQERTVAEVIIDILTDAGYIAHTVRDSIDALAVIAMVPPALIVLDIGKHTRPGAAFIGQMRAAGFGAIPIVVMSADIVATAPMLIAPNVVGSLAKPFDLDGLVACVARYVQPSTLALQ